MTKLRRSLFVLIALAFPALTNAQDKPTAAHRVVRVTEPNAPRPVEVSVAINPNDPDHIVAASQQGVANVAYVSKDAGRTWKTVKAANPNNRIQGDDAVV